MHADRALHAPFVFSTCSPSLHHLSISQLLLGILPPRPADGPAVLASKRAAYAQFCTELVLERPAGDPPPVDDDCAASAPAATEDHPLSAAPSSAWRAFHEGTSIRDQIDRDVARTHPDMHFFSGLADGGGEEGGGGAAAAPPPNTPATAARAALARALFVFAKLNPGVQYVQGMNELVAPPYFVFATGGGSGEGTAVPPPPTTSTTSPQPPPSAAEADAFHALVALMAECRDWFCPALDHGSSGTGVKATLGSLGRALAAADPPLAAHLLGTNGVDPQFFAFRWLTLWLTQEFALPDAVRLWDGILGAEPEGGGAGGESGGRPAWRAALERVCVAMLVAVRGELLGGDFAANLKLLQHYPPSVDVGRLLRLADEIGGTAAC